MDHDSPVVIPSYIVPELAKSFVLDEATKAMERSSAAASLIGGMMDAQREINAANSAKEDAPLATIYTLRVDVTVPHADGQPEYTAREIVNRVIATLRYVPGDCDVRAQEYSSAEE